MPSSELTIPHPTTPNCNLDESPLVLQRFYKTVVIVDWVESVRWMSLHEARSIALWQKPLNHVEKLILPPYQGAMIKSLGDGFLLMFDSISNAVEASIQIQQLAATIKNNKEAIQLRVGVHWNTIYKNKMDIYGQGVNLTARITAIANPGETLVA
ncbi:MAG: adenylate/guanylate cyclase domain-containing protein [Limnohabitans sp.]|nr:adenylate/guanylate cyclase domain-containing protein [Limnohabitans sp.]